MMKRLFLILPILMITLALTPIFADNTSLDATATGSGLLTFVQSTFDAKLDGANCISLSPDEQYVYVVSSTDSAVTVFRRNATSGKLSFVQAIRDGEGGANELAGASGVSVSPDGGHIYVTSWQDDSLSVFSRNTTTGKLTFVEAHKDGVDGIVSLGEAYAVVVSPDNKHVYVASRTDSTVSVFSRDTSTGELTFVEAEGDVSGLNYTTSVAISPDGKHVYAANYGHSSVTVFERNATTGELAYMSTVQDGVGGVNGLDGAIYAGISADGANVYVTGIDDDAIAVFQRNATTGALTFLEAKFDDIDGVDGLDGSWMTTTSHDGAYVYVAGTTDHSIAIFARNSSNGALTYIGKVNNGSSGVRNMYAPHWITLSQDDNHLYVADPSGDTVEIFNGNPSDGTLTSIKELPNNKGLEGAVGVTVSDNGCVYVAGYNDDAVAFFTQDPSTGELTYKNDRSTDDAEGMHGAIDVAISPDTKHVYVAGYDDDAVVAFYRPGIAGCAWLEHIDTYTDTIVPGGGLNGARDLAFSPDGSLLYVVSTNDDAVVIFDRNSSSGELTYKQIVVNSSTLDGAYAIALSPDGVNFYVASYYDDTVTIFRWTDGTLYYEGVVTDGIDGVDGLDGANSVVVSPDGSYVYVAGRHDDAVAYFWRNPSSGSLTYRGILKNGVGGVEGLNGARALAISPDGSQVYVASQYDNALAVFNRSSDDGSLTFVTAYKDGVGGIDGLSIADGIAVSPSGAYIYVSGYGDDALVTFARFRIYLPLVLR